MTTQTGEYVDGVLVSRLVDNGDGTGTRTFFDETGAETSSEPVTGLPVEPEVEPDPVTAALAVLTTHTADELKRAVVLGVEVTTPEAVSALESAVASEDPLSGVSVVRDAAAAATVEP